MEMLQTDWSQKYRPQLIGDMILPDYLDNSLRQLIQQEGGMSLLFYGKPGCGKTTMAKLINPENTMYINCTTSNSINMVRELERGCSSVTVFGGRRLILLDEADYLSKEAQAALRGLVEQYSLNNDFVMTANEPDRLSDAILSRFYPVYFDFIMDDKIKKDLTVRLWDIAITEANVDMPAPALQGIIRKCFPDVRMMIKMLQFEVMRQVGKVKSAAIA